MRGHHLIFIFVAIALACCREKHESADSNSLNVQAFEGGINQSGKKIILDVRTPEEFAEGHIQNALLIDFRDKDFKAKINRIDKQLPVYVYCASGVRSDKAATVLREEGFKEVYVLDKGLNEWRSSNKKIVR